MQTCRELYTIGLPCLYAEVLMADSSSRTALGCKSPIVEAVGAGKLALRGCVKIGQVSKLMRLWPIGHLILLRIGLCQEELSEDDLDEEDTDNDDTDNETY